MKLLNAFSLQMIDLSFDIFDISGQEILKEEAIAILKRKGVESAIGHEQTAKILSNELGMDIPFNRVNVHLERGESAIVAQIIGGRLPEGVTTLPDGFKMKYIIIQVK